MGGEIPPFFIIMGTTALIGGALALGGSIFGAVSKKRRNDRQKQMYQEQLAYNHPKEQLKRYLEAGINPYGQQYTNVNDQQLPQEESYDSDVSNASSALRGLAMEYQNARNAEIQGDILETQKQIEHENLFSVKATNDDLRHKLQQESTARDLANEGKDLENDQKKVDLKYADAKAEAEVRNLNEDANTKSTFNANYDEMIRKDFELSDAQLQQFKQIFELQRYQVERNTAKCKYMAKHPDLWYSSIEKELKYEERGYFYALEAQRIQHLMDLDQESLMPEQYEMLKAQYAYALSKANFDMEDVKNDFTNTAWYKYTQFGLDVTGKIANIAGSFGKMGVYRNLSNPERFNTTPRDYTRSFSNKNGEFMGGYSQVYSKLHL